MLFSSQAESIELEISDLRKSCDAMAEEVTKLTKGTGSEAPSIKATFKYCATIRTCAFKQGAASIRPLTTRPLTNYYETTTWMIVRGRFGAQLSSCDQDLGLKSLV